MQEKAGQVYMADSMLEYITDLTDATREDPMITLGVSPRGALALCRMTKAKAYLSDRDVCSSGRCTGSIRRCVCTSSCHESKSTTWQHHCIRSVKESIRRYGSTKGEIIWQNPE